MCGIDFFSDVSACYGTGTEGVSVEQVSAINVGDGRILFRDRKTEKPSTETTAS